MIFTLIINILFSPLFIVLEFIPTIPHIPSWADSFLTLLSKGLGFFPSDVWAFLIGNIAFWLAVQFTWAIVEWIYIKLPGVN